MDKNNKVIYGVFTDPDVTLAAVKALRREGVRIKEVYCPFPVHGLDEAMGYKPTNISVSAFVFGATGCSLAALMIWYMNIHDWPMNIGGKPSFSFAENFPAFVPVLFESTVLLAAHGMIATFYFVTKLFPGFPGRNPDKRSTDDRFVMEIDLSEQSLSEDDIKRLLQKYGASEINHP
ncbi:MAG: DUF3341 domain-containing protein [Flavobacteriales bacterium]|nr:DUF3341 domain-containing protein [Flavobacteriales bacterium]MDW8410008.1 DUF3341 domain-containing protein [Flavobacteriales bacterium]